MGNQEEVPMGTEFLLRVQAQFCLVGVANARGFRLETLPLSSVSFQVKGQTVIFESAVNISH